METSDGCRLPQQFRSLADDVYPVYHVLADVGEFAAGEFSPLAFDEPLKIGGIALRTDHGTRLLIANLSPHPQSITLPDPIALGGHGYRFRCLDTSTRRQAMAEPEVFRTKGFRPSTSRVVQLESYAIATIDVSSQGATQ